MIWAAAMAILCHRRRLFPEETQSKAIFFFPKKKFLPSP